jgi:hypothetical protein
LPPDTGQERGVWFLTVPKEKTTLYLPPNKF